MKRSPFALAISAAVLCALWAASASAGRTSTERPTACGRVQASPPRVEHLQPPPQTISRAARLEAIVKTNCGQFRIRLAARRSPVVVNSFVHLARSGFYNGLRFDRVVPDFVVQGGDPRGNGESGPGYHVVDPPPRDFRYRDGTVAMSRTEAAPRGWAGSDFFIVLGEGGAIKSDYAVLGHVDQGMATLRRIEILGTAGGRPSQVVRIDSIRIRQAEARHSPTRAAG